jgi:exonuclease III
MGYRHFKVASWNVNGLNNPVKRSRVMAKMRREKPQIIFLQETHLSKDEHEKLKQFGYKNTFYSSFKTGHKRGVAVLLHNSLNFELVKEIRDSEGRYILVQGRIENNMTTLISVYLPPQSDPKLMKTVLELIASESQGTLICAGDFNTVINREDTSNNKRTVSPQNKILRKGLEEIGLLDVWRELHPTDRDYTYFSAPHTVYSRIDFFFVFKNDRHRIINCDIGSRDISDHSPMYLTLYLDSRPKRTIWRLNTALLNNKTVIQQIKAEIKTYLEINDNGEVNPNILWDALKAVIRGKLISIGTNIKKTKEKNLKSLKVD